MVKIVSLPDELALIVIGHLGYSLDLCALSQTCRYFYSITRGHIDDTIRQLWQSDSGKLLRTICIQAAENGNAACVRRIFKVSAFIATLFAREEWALVSAARGGNTEIVQIMLDHGADPDEPHRYINPAYGNPLLAAIHEGRESVVQFLIARGVKTTFGRPCFWCCSIPYPPRPIRQPLSVAVERQHLSIVNLLLSHGCDPLAPDSKREQLPRQELHPHCAMDVAAGLNMGTLQMLMDTGVKPDFSGPTFLAERTLMRLLRKGDIQLTRFIIKHGAKVDTDVPVHRFPFDNVGRNNLTQFMQAAGEYPEQAAWLLEQLGFDKLLETGNLRQYIYLTVGAVYGNSPSLFRQVLDAGWTFRKDWASKKPDRIQNPLINRAQEWQDHLGNLLFHATEHGYLEIVKLLLDYGVDPRGAAKNKLKGTGYYPPIYAAVDGGFLEIVTLLLDRGASPFPIYRYSLLSRAIRSGLMATKMVNLVLERMLMGPQDPAGFDLITEAVEGGEEVFDLFVQYLGVEPNLKNPLFEPSFAKAVRLGHHVLIERFLQEGFDIKSDDGSGLPRLPKYLFTACGPRETVEATVDLLLKYGLDSKSQACGELIPLIYPCNAASFHIRTRKLLLKKGADPWRPFGSSSSNAVPDPLQRMSPEFIKLLLTSLDERHVPFENVKFRIEEAARSTGDPKKAQLLWRWYWRRTYPSPE